MTQALVVNSPRLDAQLQYSFRGDPILVKYEAWEISACRVGDGGDPLIVISY